MSIRRQILTAIPDLKRPPRRLTRSTRDPVPQFDWSGVRVSHWLVVSKSSATVAGDGARVRYACVSRCGMGALFTREALADGATSTCAKCRPGEVVRPELDVIPDYLKSDYPSKWEELSVEFKSNLKGSLAIEHYRLHAHPTVERLLAATKFGAAFGWKVSVRDCHMRNKPATKGTKVRVARVESGQRRIEVEVNPAEGQYRFDIDLTTGRADVPWEEIRKTVESAVMSLSVKDVGPAGEDDEEGRDEPPAAAAPTVQAPQPQPQPAPASSAMTPEVQRLISLRNGFDNAIKLAQDRAACEQLKEELNRRIRDQLTVTAPAREEYERLKLEVGNAKAALDELQDTVSRLNNQLQRAMSDRTAASATLATLQAEFEVASVAYEPHRLALEAAQKDLEDANKVEEEQARLLEQSKDLLPLLKAFEMLGKMG